MPTLAEKRAWLRVNTTEDIPARGRLRPDLETLYDQAHPDDADWDLEGLDDFVRPDETEPDVPMEPERTPRTPRSTRRAKPATQRAQGFLGKLFSDGKDKQQPKGKTKPKPRVSLENFTTRAYSALGRMVRPLAPATGNCLQAQAAMAGVLLEDAAHGTFIDRLLQGPARAEDKLNKGFALVMPPMIVFALEQNQAAVTAGTKTVQAGMMRQAVLMPMLRESLRIGLEVSEGFADQIRERLEREARFDKEIDDLIGMIFGQVQGETVPEPEMAGAAA